MMTLPILTVLLMLCCLLDLAPAFQLYPPTPGSTRRISTTRAFTNLHAKKKKKNSKSTGTKKKAALSLGIASKKKSDDDYTATTVTSPAGQEITLIGTAHLSQKSNDQVDRLMTEIRPNVIMVELDPDRLERVGVEGGVESIREKVDKVATVEDIELPIQDKEIPWYVRPIEDAVTTSISLVARKMLSGMYDDMSNEMNSTGGGEFLVSIDAAKNLTECHTLVLGDRDSIKTMKRVASLALQSGDPLGVLTRFKDANKDQMTELEDRVRERLEKKAKGEAVDESQVRIDMMETLKKDKQFRNRLFDTLEREVPEFTQSFIKERDYLMAESIRRELDAPNVERIVGVIGLGHLPGIVENLEAMFANKPVPLETMEAAS